MSSKVEYVSKRLPFTATWAADVLTVTMVSHNLVVGDTITLLANVSPQTYITPVVSVVDANTITISTLGTSQGVDTFKYGECLIKHFNTGDVGRQVITFPRSSGLSGVVQSFVTGTGGSVYDLEVSLDGVHWELISAVTHLTVDGDSKFNVIEPTWTHLAINITSIGAGTRLEVLRSS